MAGYTEARRPRNQSARWEYEPTADLNTPRCPYCASSPELLVTWSEHGETELSLWCGGEDGKEHDDWMPDLQEELRLLTADRR